VEIYIWKDKEQIGPFTPAELQEKLEWQEYSLDDLAWHEGVDGWKPIHEIFSDSIESEEAEPARPSSSPLTYPPPMAAGQPAKLEKSGSGASAMTSAFATMVGIGGLLALFFSGKFGPGSFQDPVSMGWLLGLLLLLGFSHVLGILFGIAAGANRGEDRGLGCATLIINCLCLATTMVTVLVWASIALLR
jgi:hypothetical protein